MRITIKLFLFIILVVCFSCEEQGLFVDCRDCTASEPSDTYLEINLDMNFQTGETLVKIYEGNLEDSILYKTRQVSGLYTTVTVLTNKKYTVTATYYIPGNYYIVVDSATPRVKWEKRQCDAPCYYVYDRVVDLRLNY